MKAAGGAGATAGLHTQGGITWMKGSGTGTVELQHGRNAAAMER